MSVVQESEAEALYGAALKAERSNYRSETVRLLQLADANGHLLSSLRLAQIFDTGELGSQIDREIASMYYKRAAMCSGTEDMLRCIYVQHPEDAVVFIALTCRAFLIASESGKYPAHAISAMFWFGVLKQLHKTSLLEDPDVFERLTKLFSQSECETAECRAVEWLAVSAF